MNQGAHRRGILFMLGALHEQHPACVLLSSSVLKGSDDMPNKDRLSQCLGGVDEQFIEEAERYTRRKRNPV